MRNTLKVKIAVIGGTGLEDIEGLTDIQHINIDTPFGKKAITGYNPKTGAPGYETTPQEDELLAHSKGLNDALKKIKVINGSALR